MARYSLQCLCGERIPLPLKSQLGTFTDQAIDLNHNAWPLKFVCTKCGVLSAFEETQINPPKCDLLDSESALWHVSLRCDHSNCNKRFSIWTPLPLNAARGDALHVLRHSKRPITCGIDGHIFRETMVLQCHSTDEKNRTIPLPFRVSFKTFTMQR
jgi:hypothetical protein